MTILFMDGFDHATSAELVKKWGSNNSSFPWTLTANTGINGGGAISPSSSNYPIQKNLLEPVTSFITGMIIYGPLTTSGTINIFYAKDNDLTHFTVQVQSDGAIAVRNSLLDYSNYTNKIIALSNPGIIKNNFWHYVEIKATIGLLGTISVSVDNKVIFDVHDVVMQNAANAYCTSMYYSVPGDSKGYIDDVYILNQSGAQNNNFLGKWNIDTLKPSSDGINNSFIPSTGTSHWSLVSDNIPNAATFVSTAIPGNKETYKFSSVSADTVKIFGIQISNLSSKDNLGSLGTANVIVSGGITTQSATKELSTSESSYLSIHELDPATNKAFTPAGINAAEFGIMAV